MHSIPEPHYSCVRSQARNRQETRDFYVNAEVDSEGRWSANGALLPCLTVGDAEHHSSLAPTKAPSKFADMGNEKSPFRVYLADI